MTCLFTLFFSHRYGLNDKWASERRVGPKIPYLFATNRLVSHSMLGPLVGCSCGLSFPPLVCILVYHPTRNRAFLRFLLRIRIIISSLNFHMSPCRVARHT